LRLRPSHTTVHTGPYTAVRGTAWVRRTSLPSLLRWLEITQIRRRLILVGRHQLAVDPFGNVGLVADLDPDVVQRAVLQAPHRPRIGLADGLLNLGVRPRHVVIDHRDLVIERVAVGLVEIDPFLQDAGCRGAEGLSSVSGVVPR
jgi:hypothetical protein